MLGSSFQLEIDQKLKTAPTALLIETAKLLELGTEELVLEIDKQLQANPLLERIEQVPEEAFPLEASPCDEPVGVERDFAGESLFVSWAETARRNEVEKEDTDVTDSLTQSETLFEHLEKQIGLLDLDNEAKARLTWLAGNLDEEGRLDGSFEAITQTYARATPASDWTKTLHDLQSLDPAGVGARDATETLLLQLNRLEGPKAPEELTWARALLLTGKEALLRKDTRTMAKMLDATPEALSKALGLLSRLNPRPCATFCDISGNAIIPDFSVQSRGTELTLQWRDELLFGVRFDEETYELLKKTETRVEQLQLWEKKAQQARAFVNSLEHRKRTLEQVLQAILQSQAAFFLRGPIALAPMSMSSLADTLGVSKSTISRAVANKYIQTAFGTFALKSFFSGSVKTDIATAGTISAISVRKRLRELIEAEDASKPLSDEALANQLAAEGIHLARRTVAKYREEEGIGSKSERRRL